MASSLNRRQLIQLGTFGLGAMSASVSAAIARTSGFTHEVASGEPSQELSLIHI